MNKTERKRIIDYIFRHPETPEEIRQQFERWMLAREHDSGIDEILWDIWENHAAPVSEEEDRRGLERLRASIRASRVRTLPRRVLRYAGMAAAVVLVFLGGYFAATQTLAPEKEVTLLTAKRACRGVHPSRRDEGVAQRRKPVEIQCGFLGQDPRRGPDGRSVLRSA